MTTQATIELIGAGFGRTGTTSIQRALEQLGYHAYNFEEVVARDQLTTWQRIFEGKEEPNWPELLVGYNATISWPASFYFKELSEIYPDAKFILTTRDAERWADSLLSGFKVMSALTPFRFIPRVRIMTDVMSGPMRQRLFGGDEPNKASLVASFNAHNEAVMQTIPPNRLLIYEVSQGWEPLCLFLNKAVPDTPFPYENKREDMRETAFRVLGIRNQ